MRHRNDLPTLLLAALCLAAVAAPPQAAAQDAAAPAIPAAEYAERRQRVMDAIGDDALLVLTSPPERPRNGDTTWPFRQDDDLLYLTGVAEPETSLVLMPGEETYRQVLFARDRDPQQEAWNGLIPEHDELARTSGVEEIQSSSALRHFVMAALNGWSFGQSDLYRYYRRPVMPHFLAAVREGRATVWLDLGDRFLGPVPGGHGGSAGGEDAARRLADELRAAFPEVEIRNATPLLSGLREVKSDAEAALIQRAIDVTGAAIRAGMRRALTAETENQIQATVEFTFRDLGACCWGFPSIVAAGEHTTFLHYPAGEAPVPRDGLVLLDVGAEVQGYTADVSRTFPADGTFSPEQRAIYDAVYRTSRAVLPKMRPGVAYSDLNVEATDLLAAELHALGLVSAVDRKQAEMYFFHGLGHPLGLQVHDEFDRTRVLETGMVWTLEPGLYVRPADVEASPTFKALPEEDQATIRAALERYGGIGVRIEDDVRITDGAPRLMSADIPAEPGEIEAFMAGQAGR